MICDYCKNLPAVFKSKWVIKLNDSFDGTKKVHLHLCNACKLILIKRNKIVNNDFKVINEDK